MKKYLSARQRKEFCAMIQEWVMKVWIWVGSVY